MNLIVRLDISAKMASFSQVLNQSCLNPVAFLLCYTLCSPCTVMFEQVQNLWMTFDNVLIAISVEFRCSRDTLTEGTDLKTEMPQQEEGMLLAKAELNSFIQKHNIKRSMKEVRLALNHENKMISNCELRSQVTQWRKTLQQLYEANLGCRSWIMKKKIIEKLHKKT